MVSYLFQPSSYLFNIGAAQETLSGEDDVEREVEIDDNFEERRDPTA